jgi:hypothetical protein
MEIGMNRIAIMTVCALLFAPAALADEKPTDEEAAKIKEAISAWGCEGGEYEKESEGTGVYEVDDAKCKTGQYDFKLDKDFNVISVTRD